MSIAEFSTLPVSGAQLESVTTVAVDSGETTSVASTTQFITPLQYYFRVGTPQSLAVVLADPPPVSDVINFALREPGITVHDRAVNLLGHLSGRTLWFALQSFAINERFMRSVYSNKVWEVVISALGMADDAYTPYIVTYVQNLRHDPNPVKRMAAFDALSLLQD